MAAVVVAACDLKAMLDDRCTLWDVEGLLSSRDQSVEDVEPKVLFQGVEEDLGDGVTAGLRGVDPFRR